MKSWYVNNTFFFFKLILSSLLVAFCFMDPQELEKLSLPVQLQMKLEPSSFLLMVKQ